MGLFKRTPAAPPSTDPLEAIRIAQRALADTGTYVDEHGRRRRLDAETRARMAANLESAAGGLKHT
jgi:hypothetical protein